MRVFIALPQRVSPNTSSCSKFLNHSINAAACLSRCVTAHRQTENLVSSSATQKHCRVLITLRHRASSNRKPNSPRLTSPPGRGWDRQSNYPRPDVRTAAVVLESRDE
ncbi:hypothetical protein BaRGS_00021009, partial [Batillaria attramentaria]